MGLAASQARLLTITARKSDAEFQSMRYSHDKIALSRSMTDISTEYQNSLNQTKLVYDFYGNGDTNTQLSYGLMMTPSIMNGYMPMLTTNTSGRVVLNNQYAAAAEAAGIPAEGLGCLPSEVVRDKFIQGLADAGLISQIVANNCLGVSYSQDIGMGSTDLVSVKTEKMNLQGLLDYVSQETLTCNIPPCDGMDYYLNTGNGPTSFTINDLFKNDYYIYAMASDNTTKYDHEKKFLSLVNNIEAWDGWDTIFDTLEKALKCGDPNVDAAVERARTKTENVIKTTAHGGVVDTNASGSTPGNGFGMISENWNVSNAGFPYQIANTYVGYVGFRNRGSKGLNDGISISISNIVRAYLTTFVETLEGAKSAYKFKDGGVSVTNNGSSSENHHRIEFVNSRSTANSNFINTSSLYQFDVVTQLDVNQDHAMISGFYDALFNQICSRGWTENSNIDDNEYLAQMYKDGKCFLTTCSDDGYYNTGNYSTNTYIREVTDDDAIAKAEAKYNTEKLKINQKEEIIDLKMKNLDTEISSLTTEYDTVKSIISKQIEKCFKRYDA